MLLEVRVEVAKVLNQQKSKLCEWKHGEAVNRNRNQQFRLVWRRYARMINPCLQRASLGRVLQAPSPPLHIWKMWRLNQEPDTHAHAHAHGRAHTHTLAQNSHCEFWCGMHRTCKNTKSNRHEEWKIIRIYIYIDIYSSRRWSCKATAINYMSPPSCDLYAPRGGTIILYYIRIAGTSALARHRYHIHLARSLLEEAHQGTLIPQQYIEVLHLYRWYTHTHAHRSGADEMKMKVRWKWKWNEIYLTRTRRGERKRRGTERTPTQHTWPGTGKPWKGKGKEKRGQTDNGTRPAEGGGETEAPEPT